MFFERLKLFITYELVRFTLSVLIIQAILSKPIALSNHRHDKGLFLEYKKVKVFINYDLNNPKNIAFALQILNIG